MMVWEPSIKQRQPLEEMLTPESLQKVQERLMEEIQRDKEGSADLDRSITMALEYYRRDGSTVWMENRFKMIRDPGNAFNGIIGVSRDITERKKAEEALRESEEKFRVIFEKSVQGILAVDLETKRFAYANPSICRMFGYSETEFLQLGISSIHPKDSLDHVISEFDLQKRGEKEVATELSCLRKNGTVFYADITATTEAIINHRECVVGFFADVTERKQADEALRKSEERYRVMMEQAADAVFVHDETGRIVDVNQKTSQNLGYSREELLSMSIGDIDPEAIQAGKNDIWGNILAGERFTFESRHIRKDGKFLPVELTLDGVNLNEGLAILGIARDITERKRLEFQLQQSLRMEAIGTLTGGIAHDYNNLMSIIMGNLSLAQEEAEPGSDLAHFLNEANMASHKVRDLTHELMSLSRGGRPVREVGSLDEILKNISELIPADSGISLTESISQDLKLVPYDRHNQIDSSVGAGTTVNIYLPAESGQEEMDSTITSTNKNTSPMKRLLVMDDEEMLRNLARQMLERMGYIVETVEDGLEAIEVQGAKGFQ